MSAAKLARGGATALLGTIAMILGAVLPNVAQAQESFGVSSFNVTLSTLQAGAHADVTTSFALNADSANNPIEQVKDVHIELPPGLVGDPHTIPMCAAIEFASSSCQPSSQVGLLTPTLVLPGLGTVSGPLPVYNLVPSAGHLATFGVSLLFVTIIIEVDARNDGSGGLTASLNNITTFVPLQASSLTLWGVPADPSHEAHRTNELGTTGPQPAGVPPAAFMTNPTDCAGGPSVSVIHADSWQHPGQFVTLTATEPAPTGCEQTQIAPKIAVTPDTTQVDTPAGYTIDLTNPQNEEPYGLAAAPLRTVSVTFPPGTSLSPAVANGLEGCTEAQFTADSCPNSAKVGTVSITSPLLPDQLTGSIYLAAPTPTAMFRIFLSASAGNVNINLTGNLEPDPATGQLTAVFDQLPQLPFSDLRISFFGGPTGALANPPSCGTATTTSQVTSYGGQTVSLSSSFAVDADGRGGACPAGPGFAPSFSAGTTSSVAGGFSPFTLTVSRGDAQQNLSRISAQLPAGVSAMLAQVPACGESQAAAGICPATSQVGTVTLALGAGSEPLYVTGAVYLTGPYAGAPFGLSIVVPAIVGPFNLGTVVVRARILVNPADLRLTIAADPLPQILAGIPLRLKTVNITVNRPGFIFNPSACMPQTLTGVVSSEQGATVPVSSPFQVSGCSELPLKSKLAATTQAKESSKGNGASLNVNVLSPGGTAADLRSVIVDLPARLRPRLSTIQQACLAVIFHADPAKCPAASLVGSVTVDTPVLAAPLTGPIYMVFRGGSAFPDLVMLPQGQGVGTELEGALSIGNDGIVSAAFRGLPDVPISSFKLELPRGPHSLLGVTASPCSGKLNMPYTIAGQNNTQLTGTVGVAVSGCPKHRAKKTAKKG